MTLWKCLKLVKKRPHKMAKLKKEFSIFQIVRQSNFMTFFNDFLGMKQGISTKNPQEPLVLFLRFLPCTKSLFS